MEFTEAELFLLQSLIDDGLKTLDNIRGENMRNTANCVFSHQFLLNNTVTKAADVRIQDLMALRSRFSGNPATEAAPESSVTVQGEAA